MAQPKDLSAAVDAQHLAERAANAKSIARFGTAFGLHQAVDFTLAGGVGTQQKRKRVLHPGCARGVARPPRGAVGIREVDVADTWTQAREQLRI